MKILENSVEELRVELKKTQDLFQSNIIALQDSITAEKERRKYADINLQRRGFFGGLQTPLPNDVIDLVIKVKKDNPSWTNKEIYEKLKKDNVKISDSDIPIILGVYFGEL